MYDSMLELLYNDKISYFSIKNLNDAFTSKIIDELKYPSQFVLDLYKDVKKIFNDDIIMKGGSVVQNLIDEDPKGDLDVEIKWDKEKMDNAVLKYMNVPNLMDNEDITFDTIVQNNNEKELNNILDKFRVKYFDELNNIVNNINLEDIVPHEIKYNDRFFLFESYKEVGIEIIDVEKITLLNEITRSVSFINQTFILFRYYFPIIIKCKSIRHNQTLNTTSNYIKCKFLFFDIGIQYSKELTEKVIINYDTPEGIKSTEITRYNISYVISDQIATMINSFLRKSKLAKRVARMTKLLNKYSYLFCKDSIVPNINKNIMFNKVEILLRKIPPLNNYRTLKKYVMDDKFIYLLKNVSFFSTIDSDIIETTPADYIKTQLIKMFNAMDSIIESELSMNTNTDIKAGNKTDNILNELIKEFKLTSEELKSFHSDDNKLIEHIKLYQTFNNISADLQTSINKAKNQLIMLINNDMKRELN